MNMLNVSEQLIRSKHLFGIIRATFPEAKEKANRFGKWAGLNGFQGSLRKNRWAFWVAVKWNEICAVSGYLWGILRVPWSRRKAADSVGFEDFVSLMLV